MHDFSPVTAVLVFATYVVIDVLYAAYIIAVGDRRAVRAAALSAVIYSLLAYGVVTFSKNIAYLVPLSAGAFVGTYVTVRWRGEAAKPVLTDEERGVLGRVADDAGYRQLGWTERVVRGLLERLR
jgi:hypothetical protein